MSLDRMRDYLSSSPDGLDPYRLAAQTQIILVVAMVTAKVGVESARLNAQLEATLQRLVVGCRTRGLSLSTEPTEVPEGIVTAPEHPADASSALTKL
jgi:hypothetical protein